MARRVTWLSVLAALAVFGACFAALALLRVGVPFLVSALGLSLLAGAALYAVLHTWLAQPMAELANLRDRAGAAGADRARLAELEANESSLRHDLRGVLSPALLMADRLVAHEDPGVRRAGETVVKSIERATALLSATRRAEPSGGGSLPPQQP